MSQSNETILRFYQKETPDIHLSNNNTTARRIAMGTNLLFSSHPLKPHEKFTIRLSEISDKTKEIMNIGFTPHHPSESHQQGGGSLKIVSFKNHKRIKNKNIYFFYTPNGRICFGVDGQEKGHKGGVPSAEWLWAFVYIINPNTTIEVLNCCSLEWSNLNLAPMMLHQNRGRNVKLIKNTIYKYDRRLEVSYAFTVDPVRIGEYVIVKILDIDFRSKGGLSFGVTSLNPSHLEQKELPDDTGLFLTKPGYSFLINDPSWGFKQNDKISFMISPEGRIKIWRNESTLLKEVEVNASSQLWVFFDIADLESVEVWSYLSLPELEKSDLSDWKEVKNEAVISTQKQISGSDDDSTMCIVCCEKVIEAALYPCGHMCLCSDCAKEQWRGTGHGCCPMCRVKIKDVLKIYKI